MDEKNKYYEIIINEADKEMKNLNDTNPYYKFLDDKEMKNLNDTNPYYKFLDDIKNYFLIKKNKGISEKYLFDYKLYVYIDNFRQLIYKNFTDEKDKKQLERILSFTYKISKYMSQLKLKKIINEMNDNNKYFIGCRYAKQLSDNIIEKKLFLDNIAIEHHKNNKYALYMLNDIEKVSKDYFSEKEIDFINKNNKYVPYPLYNIEKVSKDYFSEKEIDFINKNKKMSWAVMEDIDKQYLSEDFKMDNVKYDFDLNKYSYNLAREYFSNDFFKETSTNESKLDDNYLYDIIYNNKIENNSWDVLFQMSASYKSLYKNFSKDNIYKDIQKYLYDTYYNNLKKISNLAKDINYDDYYRYTKINADVQYSDYKYNKSIFNETLKEMENIDETKTDISDNDTDTIKKCIFIKYLIFKYFAYNPYIIFFPYDCDPLLILKGIENKIFNRSIWKTYDKEKYIGYSYGTNDIKNKNKIDTIAGYVMMADSIKKCIESNIISIIKLPTGTGKTLYIPSLLVDTGIISPIHDKILITEPLIASSKDISIRSEINFGAMHDKKFIGYHAGGENMSSSNTFIFYSTEATVYTGLINNPKYLDKFSYIIIDEAHEFKTHMIYILSILLKRIYLNFLYNEKPKFKLIIISASIDIEKLYQKLDNVKQSYNELFSKHKSENYNNYENMKESYKKKINEIIDDVKKIMGVSGLNIGNIEKTINKNKYTNIELSDYIKRNEDIMQTHYPHTFIYDENDHNKYIKFIKFNIFDRYNYYEKFINKLEIKTYINNSIKIGCVEWNDISNIASYNNYLGEDINKSLNEKIIKAIKRSIEHINEKELDLNDYGIIIFLTSKNEITNVKSHIIKNINNITMQFGIYIYSVYSKSRDLYNIINKNTEDLSTQIKKSNNNKNIKIYLATNAVETGVTLQNIFCVIDNGHTHNQIYLPHIDAIIFYTSTISLNSYEQRNGRMGRTIDIKNCIYIPLYDENDYNKIINKKTQDYQIFSDTNIDLYMKTVISNNPISFILTPTINAILYSISKMKKYNMITINDNGKYTIENDKNITSLTSFYNLFPVFTVDNIYLIQLSIINGMIEEIVSLIAMYSANFSFKNKNIKTKYKSDHIALINLHKIWLKLDTNDKKNFCKIYDINSEVMDSVDSEYFSILSVLKNEGFIITSIYNNNKIKDKERFILEILSKVYKHGTKYKDTSYYTICINDNTIYAEIHNDTTLPVNLSYSLKELQDYNNIDMNPKNMKKNIIKSIEYKKPDTVNKNLLLPNEIIFTSLMGIYKSSKETEFMMSHVSEYTL